MHSFIVFLLSALLSTPSSAQSATNPGPHACPNITQEAVRWIRANGLNGKCNVRCDGCGCQAGPGYRWRGNCQCVGHVEMVRKCGEPPHYNGSCIRECTPIVIECRGHGREYLRTKALPAGLQIEFTEVGQQGLSLRQQCVLVLPGVR